MQLRKLDKAFSHLDADGSGYVEQQDLHNLGVRLLANFGVDGDAPKARRMAEDFGMFWQELAKTLDVDHDRRLSLQEWRAGMTSAFVHGDAFDRSFRPGALAVLRLADTDDDGLVSRDEFATMQRAFGTPVGEISLAFDKLDADEDGFLTVDEMMVGVRQFYIGADETAPGNWFFGTV
ncbi:calcium-binding protein [Catellatospora sp. TT07R-123]|nr:calcium-binding protein [Catellatospora sp. TT07R-123]